MRTRTKVILTCILGALFVAGLVLLIVSADRVIHSFRFWLRDYQHSGKNGIPVYLDLFFYFIADIIFLLILATLIFLTWYNKPFYKESAKAKVYEEQYRKEQHQKKWDKIYQLNEEIKQKQEEITKLKENK